MNKEELVNKNSSKAVRDLNSEILKDKNLWYSYIINLPIKLQTVYTIVNGSGPMSYHHKRRLIQYYQPSS